MPLKLLTSNKVVPNFRHGKNIHCDWEITSPPLPSPPPHTLKLRHFVIRNVSRNRHMKYNMKISMDLNGIIQIVREGSFNVHICTEI